MTHATDIPHREAATKLARETFRKFRRFIGAEPRYDWRQDLQQLPNGEGWYSVFRCVDGTMEVVLKPSDDPPWKVESVMYEGFIYTLGISERVDCHYTFDAARDTWTGVVIGDNTALLHNPPPPKS